MKIWLFKNNDTLSKKQKQKTNKEIKLKKEKKK